jgi:hypothetical protein
VGFEVKKKQRREQQPTSATELIEEAMHLLRMAPASMLLKYYAGTLPFVLGLLYFWGDMSRHAVSRQYCAFMALGLGLLFIWMKYWQTIFSIHVSSRIGDQEIPQLRFSQMSSMIFSQGIIQPSGLLMIPLATVLVFPFCWVYAFYQNVTIQGEARGKSLGSICRDAGQQALISPGQNHILILTFTLFAVFIYLNLAATLFLLPHLLKKLLGIETLFSLSGSSFLNSTFLATTFALTFLCLDPVVKATYALRCFYGESLTSGNDLKVRLNRFSSGTGIHLRSMLLAILIVVATLASAPPAVASPLFADTEAREMSAAFPGELDSAIGRVLKQRRFSWRMPRAVQPEEEGGKTSWITSFVKTIAVPLEIGYRWVAGWIKKLSGWFKDFFSGINPDPDREKGVSTNYVRYYFYLFFAILVAALLWLSRDLWLPGKNPRSGQSPERIPEHPDLVDDQLRADALPADGWIGIANDLVQKGKPRLALRAFYLAGLSHLADHGLITLASYKSNRDYRMELDRRAHQEKGILSAFAANSSIFDRTWYGMYPVSQGQLELFTVNFNRIRAFARKA